MLGKLLNKNKSTNNVGNNGGKSSKSGDMEYAVIVSFPKLGDEYSHEIVKKLTIGSEVGELILTEPTVSPRHCTFILNQNQVVMIIDHSSADGTFINKKRLDAGKMFFVSEKDKIKIGSLEAKIEIVEVPIEVEEDEIESFEDDFNEGTQGFEAEEFEQGTTEIPAQEVEPDDFLEDDSHDDPLEEFGMEEMAYGQEQDNDLQLDDGGMDLDESRAPTPAQDMSLQTSGGIQLQGEKTIVKEEEDVEEVDLDPAVLAHLNTGVGKVEEKTLVLQGGKIDTFSSLKEENTPKKKKSFFGFLKRKKVVKAAGKAGKKAVPKKKYVEAAANGLYRFLAVIIDVIIMFTIWDIFKPFKDFETFFTTTPKKIVDFIVPHVTTHVLPHYQKLIKEVPEIDKIYKDIASFEHLASIGLFVLLFISLRIVGSIIFGTSLGSVMLGLTSRGNFFLKRIIAPIREVLGLLLLPFIIFDLPTLFSKRSFKEIMTRTHIVSFSGAFAIVGSIVWIIVLSIGYGLSPLVKGLEILPTIPVEIVENKIKPWDYKEKSTSSFLDLSYENSSEYQSLPSFEYFVSNKKNILRPGISLVNKLNGKALNIYKVKSFNMEKLYKPFVELNLLSEYFQPTIYAYIKDVSNKNKNFKKSKINNVLIAEETKNLIKSIYSLNIENMPDFLIEQGALARGHRDFREKLSSLLEEKVSRISFFNLKTSEGVFPVLSAEHDLGKDKYYSIIPLNTMETSVYKFSIDPASPKIKRIMSHVSMDNKDAKPDPISSFIEDFSTNPKKSNAMLSQYVYERYYSMAKFFMENVNTDGLNNIANNAKKLQTLIEKYKKSHRKLYQNLTELIKAIEDQDKRFFQIQETESV